MQDFLHKILRKAAFELIILLCKCIVTSAITFQPFRSQCTFSLPPKIIRKPYEGREREHWERRH